MKVMVTGMIFCHLMTLKNTMNGDNMKTNEERLLIEPLKCLYSVSTSIPQPMQVTNSATIVDYFSRGIYC